MFLCFRWQCTRKPRCRAEGKRREIEDLERRTGQLRCTNEDQKTRSWSISSSIEQSKGRANKDQVLCTWLWLSYCRNHGVEYTGILIVFNSLCKDRVKQYCVLGYCTVFHCQRGQAFWIMNYNIGNCQIYWSFYRKLLGRAFGGGGVWKIF